ncbi:MAG TPA: cupin domain-containing protein [Acidimicrobiales bacterium]|nr:cupin domain-containing protein [Acidimicrobiales bacterium]
MPNTLFTAQSMRRTETPNAVMTTIASPSQGPTDGVTLWKVAMRADQQGPLHVFDREQIWHVLTGEVEIALGGERLHLVAGDAAVLPAGAERQVTAVTATEMVVCGPAEAVVTVPGEDDSRGTPPWIS